MSEEKTTQERVSRNTGEEIPADGNKEKRRKNRNRNGRGPAREGRFEGRCIHLKGYIYDVVTGRGTYQKTTKEIAEYIGRTYEDAGEFRTGLVNLRLPVLVPPANPTSNADTATIEIWKEKRKIHVREVTARKRNSERAFALVLGQCTEALRNRIEADTRWNDINNQSDIIELLSLIRGCMSQKQTRRNDVHQRT